MTSDSLAYAWEHWEQVRGLHNPAGYLFRVGQSKARWYHRPRIGFPAVVRSSIPEVEPGLSDALGRSTRNQRIAVVLVVAMDWTCISVREGPAKNGAGLLAAIVGDPINGRTVLIYGYGDGFDGERYHDVNDIWAIDFNTNEWTHLLMRSGEMTYEQED